MLIYHVFLHSLKPSSPAGTGVPDPMLRYKISHFSLVFHFSWSLLFGEKKKEFKRRELNSYLHQLYLFHLGFSYINILSKT